MIQVDDMNFMDEVSQATKPTLVCFGSSSCAPCRHMQPILEKLEHDCPDIKFVKVYAEEAPDTCCQLGIRNVPTIVLFKDSQNLDALVGFQNEYKLRDFLQTNGVCG
jgi:thioredoxin 1